MEENKLRVLWGFTSKISFLVEKKPLVSEETTMVDHSLHSGEKRSCHGHLPWDCPAWSLLQRRMKELARLCRLHSAPLCRRQLYRALEGVTSGEQQPEGTPATLLGSLGSHKASGPHSSRSFTWSSGLAACHWVVGIKGCVWKTTTPQACLETQPKWPNLEDLGFYSYPLPHVGQV